MFYEAKMILDVNRVYLNAFTEEYEDKCQLIALTVDITYFRFNYLLTTPRIQYLFLFVSFL